MKLITSMNLSGFVQADLSMQEMPPNGWTLVVIICLVNFLSNSAYSSIAPFYPNEAISKGVDISMLGLVFSCYSLAMFIFSPFFKMMLDSWGCKPVLIMGLLTQGTAMIIFGLFTYINSATWYLIGSMFCRFLQGYGNGCLNSGTSNLMMNAFPAKKLGKLNGMLQTSVGLGMMFGPIMGSVLFELGGFTLPFYTVGVMLFLLAVAIQFSVKKVGGPGLANSNSNIAAQSPDVENSLSFWAVLKNFDIWTCALCLSMSLLCLTFKEPILAVRLESFDCSVTLIGIIFSLETISFTATSMGLQCVKEEANGKKYGRMEYYGMLIFVVSCILYGPANFLPDELWLICTGIVVGGIAGSLINNNSSVAMMLTEKKEAVVRLYGKEGRRLTKAEDQSLKSSVASINTGAFGLGSILGPILGSALTAEFGYRQAFFIAGMATLVVSFLQLYSQFFYKRPRKDKPTKEVLL